MSEYQLFCYSKNFNDEKSFQQKRYRAFNQEVGKARYEVLVDIVKSIIPNPGNLSLTDFWKSITVPQWKQLLEIPEAKDFKSGFEYISGITIKLDLIGNTKEIEIEGIKYKVQILEKI